MTSCWFLSDDDKQIQHLFIQMKMKWWSSTDVHSSMEETVHQVTCLNILEAGLQEDSDQHNKEGNIYGVIIYNILWTAHIEIIFIRCWFIFIHIPMRECISVLGQSQVSTYAEKVGLFLIGELSDRVGWSAKHAGSETATCSTGTSGRRPIPCQSKTRQEWSDHLCLELFDGRK